MNSSMLAELIEQGENVSLEFKSNDVRPESLAREAGLVHFDVAPVERTDRTSLDDSKLHQYFDTYYQRDYLNLEAVEQQQLLINTDMLIEKEGAIRPASAACSYSASSRSATCPRVRSCLRCFAEASSRMIRLIKKIFRNAAGND